jgi:hypothetical protein
VSLREAVYIALGAWLALVALVAQRSWLYIQCRESQSCPEASIPDLAVRIVRLFRETQVSASRNLI